MTFTTVEIERLRAPHVAQGWFAELDLPSGFWRLHAGSGTVTVDGKEWRGIGNPVTGQLVSIGRVQAQRFGSIPVVDIVIAGVNVAFMKSVRDMGSDLEGRSCNLYWGAFDQETEELIGSLKLFTPGKISAATLVRKGIAERYIVFTIEGPLQALKFPYGRMWNPAQQRYLFPGDKGLDFMGVKVLEKIT